MIKHYVEILYPSIIGSDREVLEISERDLNLVKLPEGSFGFRFKDREEIELNGKILKSDFCDTSGWYYYGKKMTLEDVIREKPTEVILINNMKSNNLKSIVWTKFGQAISLRDKDIVILE